MARIRSLAVVPALVLAACGTSTPTTTPSSPSPTPSHSVAVEEKDYSITPATATAAAGAVTFTVTNLGPGIHEFVVIKTDLAPEALPVKDDLVEENKIDSPGEIEDIEPGKPLSKTITVVPGNYVLICNLVTHYGLGMRAALKVV